MRTDMTKVVHEAYRYGRSLIAKPGRMPRDIDNLVTREGIRRPYHDGWGRSMKESNSHSAPLRRYLNKQVGRPWNLVYSEICRSVDARTPVSRIVLGMIDRWVTTKNLYEKDGQVLEAAPYFDEPSPPSGLYVHPRTGILLRATGKSWQRVYRESEAQRRAEETAMERIVSKTQKLVRVGDIWFMVEFAKVTPPREMVAYEYTDASGVNYQRKQFDPESVCRDVLTGDEFTTRFIAFNPKTTTYAKSKRQASHKEMKQHGIL